MKSAEWPYYIDAEFQGIEHSFKIQRWLTENIGPQHTNWELISLQVDNQRWLFKCEKNLLLFKLKFS